MDLEPITFKHITVCFYSNPFTDDKKIDCHLISTQTLGDIALIYCTDLKFCELKINGQITFDYAYTFKDGDFITITQIAGVAESAFAIAAAANVGKTASWIIYYVAYVAISIAISYALKALLAPATKDEKEVKNDKNRDQSLTSGNNNVNKYGVLPVVLGTHRLVPDYDATPFTQFIPFRSKTEIIPAGDPVEYPIEPSPPPSGSWTVITGDIYGDNQPISMLRYDYDGYGHPFSHVFTFPHVFVYDNDPMSSNYGKVTTYWEYLGFVWYDAVNYRTYPALSPVFGWQTYSALLVFEYASPEDAVKETLIDTMELTSIYNFGLGIINISDLRVGTTLLSDYRNITQSWSYTGPSAGAAGTLGMGYAHPHFIQTSTAIQTDFYPTFVQTLDGGVLQRNSSVENDGWLTRSGGDEATIIQVDLQGQQFSNNGSTSEFTQVEMEYKLYNSPTWIPATTGRRFLFPSGTTSFVFPYNFIGDSFNTVRTSIHIILPIGKYDVRVRKAIPDRDGDGSKDELSAYSIKFWREDDTPRTGQFRLGVVAEASTQLNGTMDTLSGLVKNMVYTWTGGAYDNSYPPLIEVYPYPPSGWLIGETSNPAWQFLHFALGVFENTTTEYINHNGAPLDPRPAVYRGFSIVPHPDNGQRLYGGGIAYERIDFAKIVAWAAFCDAQGLTCNAVLTGQYQVSDVLNNIARCGRASMTWANGKCGVVWQEAGQPSVAVFGMANIVKDSFSIAYRTDSRVDEVVCTYLNPDKDWQQDEIRVAVPDVVYPNKEQKVELWGVTDAALALREANLLAASQFYHRRTISFTADIEGASVQRGDVIQLSHDLTQWGYSGRLVAFTDDGINVLTVKLSRPMKQLTGNVFAMLRDPSGVIHSLECSPILGESDTLTLITAFSVANMPQYKNDGVDINLASLWDDSIPADFVFIAGETASAGKRCRILDVQPSDNNMKIKITATDETDDFFAHEYDGYPAVYAPFDSGERIVCRAFGAGFETRSNGLFAVWTLEGAVSATVSISVNMGGYLPVTGTVDVAGSEIALASYPSGTILSIVVIPKPSVPAYSIENGTATITL